MNLNEEITRIKASGYNELYAQAKLGQDIVLKATLFSLNHLFSTNPVKHGTMRPLSATSRSISIGSNSGGFLKKRAAYRGNGQCKDS